VEAMGYYPAIILNVFLYAFGHIPKGWKEVLGCILLGPVLCVLALKTQNIAIPILVHLALCLSNEFFSIRAEELAQKKSSAQL
jgi:membrane protease YdiL (CAAX protease family)